MALGVREISGEAVIESENGEEVMLVLPGVDLVLANLPPHSPGTLYITTKQVIWVNDLDTTKGYAVDFLSISLHAVSTDPQAYPLPCLYTQIDTQEDDHSDSESTNLHDLSTIREMRLIPSDPAQLDSLFQIFCECAELNPEPNDGEEDGEEHDWVFNTDQMDDEEAEEEDGYIPHNPTNSLGHSNGNDDLARNVLELQINDQRFEDAEEHEHEHDGNGTHR